MRVTNLLRSLLRWRTENAWHPHAAESVPARPRGTSPAKMAEPRTDAIHRGWGRAHPHRHALPRSNAPGRAAALRRWSPDAPVPVRPRRQIAVHAAVATQPHRHIGRCPGAAAAQRYQADSGTLWAPIGATGTAGLRRPPTICLQVMIGAMQTRAKVQGYGLFMKRRWMASFYAQTRRGNPRCSEWVRH